MLEFFLLFSSSFVGLCILFPFIYDVIPHIVATPYMYSYKKLRSKKIIFNTQMASVWVKDNFYVIVLNDGTIGFVKEDSLLCKVEFGVNNHEEYLLQHVILNNNHCRVKYASKQHYFVINIHKEGFELESNLVDEFILEISKPQCSYITNQDKGLFCINEKGKIIGFELQKGYCSNIRAYPEYIEMAVWPQSAYFVFVDSPLNVVTGPERKKVLKSMFGYIDTSAWQQKIKKIEVLVPFNTLKSLNIQKLIKKENWTLFLDYDRFLLLPEFKLKDFCGKVFAEKFFISLTALGFSKLVRVSVLRRHVVEIKDFVSGYKVYIKFESKVCHVEHRCIWNDDRIYIFLKEATDYEFVPFYLEFDCDKLTYNSVLDLHNVPHKCYCVLYSKPKILHLNVIFELVNRSILQGEKIDLNKIFKDVLLTSLPSSTQFLCANLLLTSITVTGDESLLYNDDFKHFLIERCHYLSNVSVGTARCFVKKLLPYIKDNKIIDFLLDFMFKTKKVRDYNSWEYVFTSLLGVTINNSKLVLEKDSTYEKFDGEIFIMGKTIKLSRDRLNKNIKCNGRIYVDMNQITLDNKNELVIEF